MSGLAFFVALTALPLGCLAESIERIWVTQGDRLSVVTVSWETAEPKAGLVEFGPAPDRLDQSARSSAQGTLHHVEISLPRRGPLYYRVVSGEHVSGVHRLRDAPEETFKVAIVGNAGFARQPWANAVLGTRPHLLLTTGDNIPALHTNGRATTPDDVSAFRRLIDSAPELFRSTPILPALGNHDREFRPRGAKPGKETVYDRDAIAFRKFFALPGEEWIWNFEAAEFGVCFVALDLSHLSDFGTTWQSCQPFDRKSQQFGFYRQLLARKTSAFLVTLYNEQNSRVRALEGGEWGRMLAQGSLAVSGFGYFAERAEVDGLTFYNTSLNGTGDRYPDPQNAFIRSSDNYLLLTFEKGGTAFAAELRDLEERTLDRQLVSAPVPRSGDVVVNAKRVRLGVAGAPEWEQFAADPPEATRLDVSFSAKPNGEEATLFIRQDDVKQEWLVNLNGRRLGKLFLMEEDLIHTLPIPAGALRTGDNTLSIFPALPDTADDIVLQEITIAIGPPREATNRSTLAPRVTDPEGNPLPARITVQDQRGTLVPMIAADGSPPLAVRPGVAYTGSGEARLGLRPGRYRIHASRGFEYSVASAQLDIAAGETHEVTLRIAREVPTPGWVSCDTHVHTFTHSRHGDAALDERMLTLAGENVELPIATDHNLHADYSEAAQRMNVSRWFTPVIGNEVTTARGHFNIFPIHPGAPVVDAKITDWPKLMEAIRATPGVRAIVLNHPRSIHSGFRPFARENFNAATGENKVGPEFGFNTIEILNSGAQQTDYLRVYRDWFALLNHGYRITAVGASDSHDVSRFIVGQARTYIAASDENPARIDVDAACRSLLEGRALVSMGLLTHMTVNEKFSVGDLATGLEAEISVDVRVLGPHWVNADPIALFANGVQIREESIDSSGKGAPKGERARRMWRLPRPRHDVHLVAIATGPPVTEPFWAMTRPYQPSSSRWQGRSIGSTNPIWLDADGDGRFTPARAYARKLVDAYRHDPGQLISALAHYDEAVAAQAASLCSAAGVDLHGANFAEALNRASAATTAGFANWKAEADPPAPR